MDQAFSESRIKMYLGVLTGRVGIVLVGLLEMLLTLSQH